MKTAEELGLSQEEYNALLKVRALLDSTPTERKEVLFGNEHERRWTEELKNDPNNLDAVSYYVDEEELSVLDGFGGFNMQYQCRAESVPDSRYYDCGTTACIAGWMGVFMWDKPPVIGEKHIVSAENQERITNFVNDFDKDRGTRRYAAVCELFYPSAVSSYSRITPQHAVQAIDSILETGEVNWRHIMYDDECWDDECWDEEDE